MSDRWTPDSLRANPVLQVPDYARMPRHWRMSSAVGYVSAAGVCR